MKNSFTLSNRIMSVILPVIFLLLHSSIIAKIISPDYWAWQNPFPQGNDLYAVWGNTSNDVFAVGAAGTILHFDGISWIDMNSGTMNNLHAVWGRTSTDVFAVGDAGTILHYDGTAWSSQSTGINTLNGIWGGSLTSDVYAVGDSGTILYYDGAAWTNQNSGTSLNLKGIWGSLLSDVYAVGDSGIILHSDGISWSTTGNTVQSNFNGIWGSSSRDVYAAGSGGVVLHFDGNNWQKISGRWSKYDKFTSVWGSSPTDVYLGKFEDLLHFDGVSWNYIYVSSCKNCNGLWGSSSTDFFCVGSTGILAHYDGIRLKVIDGNGRYFWPAAISGTSATNAVAVGGMGIMENYDGSTWKEAAGFDWGDGFSGVWANTSTDLYATASDGLIGHFKGGSEWDFDTISENDLNGIWGNSSNGTVDIFTVGDSGTILEGDGTFWSIVSSNLTRNLHTVWGSSSQDSADTFIDVFAAGDSGTVIHYDMETSTEMNSGTCTDLYGIWGSSPGDFFAVGLGGTIIHFDGLSWSRMNSTTENDLFAVWGSSSSDVFAVGDSGTVLHYDGDNWRSMNSGTFNKLIGVWGSTGSDVFVIGNGSTILHYEPPVSPDNPVPTTTSISPVTAALHSSDLVITVNGSGFISTSSVRINGTGRTTTYIDSTRLTAIVPASDFGTAGTLYLTVFNPNAINGKGVSNPQMFTIPKVPTTLSVASVSGTCGDKTITLSARLTLTSGEYPPISRKITFSLNGVAVGTAYASQTNPAVLENVSLENIGGGRHSGCITAVFAGDDNYLASNGSGDLTLQKAATSLKVYPAVGRYGGEINLDAILRSDNVPVCGKALVFRLNGISIRTAVTDNDGRVLLRGIPLGNISSGEYKNSVSVYFAGDADYASCKEHADLTVYSLYTSIRCPDQVVHYPGNSFSVTADVWSPGKTVDEGYVEFTVTTLTRFISWPLTRKLFRRKIVVRKKVNITSGKATVNYNSQYSLPIGTYDVNAVYTGSDNFRPCSTVSRITVRELTTNEIDQLVRRYAPLVYFHPYESYFPMDADAFIRNSSLNWSHEKTYDCNDIPRKGAVDPHKLGNGGYSHRVKKWVTRIKWKFWKSDMGFKHSGRYILSSEFCPPHKGVAGNEGFFLNLDNGKRKGNSALNAPVYYEFSSGNYITYWFLYGFNEAVFYHKRLPNVFRPDHNLYSHEGDWEGICILLNKNNEPVSVNFFAHGNSPKNVPWNKITMTQGTHPIIYSAKGSHASYPTTGVQNVPDWFDDMTAQGKQWRTWYNCRKAVDQPWYGYGGSWGEVNEKYSTKKIPLLNLIWSKEVSLAAPVGPGHKDQKTGADR